MRQLKFSLKIWNNILIGEGPGLLGPLPGYALDKKNDPRPDLGRPELPIGEATLLGAPFTVNNVNTFKEKKA